jgi:uncharacterized delta-60 repeat protein
MRYPFLTLIAAAARCLGVTARGDPSGPKAGTLDPAFGDGGMVVTDFSEESIRAIAIQPDGKLVVVGGYAEPENPVFAFSDFVVARYHPDGRLDETFGDGGRIVTDLAGEPISGESAVDVAILPDGRILVAGNCLHGYGPLASQSDFAIVLYTPDGSLDPTFGAGGIVLTDFRGRNEELCGLAVQPDGRIIAAGNALVKNRWNYALARYTPDGVLDETFGSGGKVLVDVGEESYLQAVALQPDGRILVAGDAPHASGSDDTDFAVIRFSQDGRRDKRFGEGGVARVDFFGLGERASGLAIQDDGRIVVVGTTMRRSITHEPAVARLRSDGSLDRSFGGNGKVALESPSTLDGASAVLLQPDGRILVGSRETIWLPGLPFEGVFAIARLNPNGRLDRTFGDKGWARTDFPGWNDALYGLALAPGGQIMAAGTTGATFAGDFALACYTNDLESAPRIAGAEIVGNALYVRGANFGDGARVLVNGKKIATANDGSDPAGLLVGEGIDAAIDPGETVVLRVRNRDWRHSNQFAFTRPAS